MIFLCKEVGIAKMITVRIIQRMSLQKIIKRHVIK